MHSDLETFIAKARDKHLTDDEIKQKLLSAGWAAQEVEHALGGDDLVVPWPPSNHGNGTQTGAHAQLAVVENLSPRGFEYKIFSVSLVLALYALIAVADSFMDGSFDSWVTFPLTILIVTGPIALGFFLRLHRAEQRSAELHNDPSRRKVVQAIQLVTFLGVVIHTVIMLYLIISGHYTAGSTAYDYYAPDKPHLVGDILRWLVTIVLAGGTFLYYWRDDHRKV